MIADLLPKPPDPLLKVLRAFREDPRDHKIDLGVGVYRDEHGVTPVMRAVKEAERRLVAKQKTKAYVGQQGNVEFLHLLGELTFAAEAEGLVSIQSVGGTGALRLGCDLLRASGARRVLLPTPSWPNHPAIIAAAGLERLPAPFFDIAEQRIDLDGLVGAFSALEPGDSIILQACCHNPLGADFTQQHWDTLAEAVLAHKLTPFIDIAYQGFGAGLDEDMAGARRFLARIPQAVMSVSGAKTFGLYRERVGALYVKAPKAARDAVSTHLYAIARANYSMPPDHGAACVATLLGDSELRADWREELEDIRTQITSTRKSLSAARLNAIPMQMIGAQSGMFSTLPLSPEQVDTLRDKHGIYMTDDARINVAGLRAHEVSGFIDALAQVSNDS